MSNERKVVFVDPQEKGVFWWPGMVVPEADYEIFKKSMNLTTPLPSTGEYLVCYFEDASFSVVSVKDTMSFTPTSSPYTDYITGPDSEEFMKDKAVILATLYYETGKVPPTFTWMKKRNGYQQSQQQRKKRKTPSSPIFQNQSLATGSCFSCGSTNVKLVCAECVVPQTDFEAEKIEYVSGMRLRVLDSILPPSKRSQC